MERPLTPSVVTAGELTPKVLMEFEQACHNFFSHAKGGVPNSSKVSRILPSFQDQLVQDWISSVAIASHLFLSKSFWWTSVRPFFPETKRINLHPDSWGSPSRRVTIPNLGKQSPVS